MSDVEIHKLYDNSVEVQFRGGARHTYKVNGKAVVGVSSFVAVLNKPDLLGWAAYEASEYFKKTVAPFALTADKASAKELELINKAAKKAHTRKSDRGKDAGTIAHEWIKEETESGVGSVARPAIADELAKAANTKEERDKIEDSVSAAKHPVKLWRQWMKDYQIEIIEHERVVYSKKLDYAGTVDVIYKSKRDGKIFVGDYKTSEPQKIRNSKFVIMGHKAYPEHFVQTTAYDYAYNEEVGLNADGYSVIYLPKDPKFKSAVVFERDTPRQDREAWEALVDVYWWQQAIKKNKTIEEVKK